MSYADGGPDDLHEWPGMESYKEGDVLRLLLDMTAGTLTVKKNGRLLGVPMSGSLTGDLCWEASTSSDSGTSLRIKEISPEEF
jgi:hypothetical protein